jgi:hypothetical protein
MLYEEASRDACLRAGIAGVVTAASLTTSSDGDTTESKVRAAAVATEDVVVSAIIGTSTGDIDERNAGNSDTVRWVTSWATVEVVLLDIDTVVCDTRQGNVLVDDVADL